MWVSLTRLITQGFHALRKVAPRKHAADFRPYKAPMITAVLLASLPNSGPNLVHTFFCCRHLNISIQDVAPLHLKIIEGSNHQGNSHCLSRHCADVLNKSQCLGHMASCHKPGLSSEILHFDVKHHVTSYKLVAYGN